MRYLSIILLVTLTACTPQKIVPRQGDFIKATPEQAIVQCEKQPELDWCRHGK